MDIFKTFTQPQTASERPARPAPRQVARVDDTRAAPARPTTDRRVQPDRRRRQQAFNGPDRRKKNSRRRPMLLHPRTREATTLEDRRGRNISTTA